MELVTVKSVPAVRSVPGAGIVPKPCTDTSAITATPPAVIELTAARRRRRGFNAGGLVRGDARQRDLVDELLAGAVVLHREVHRLGGAREQRAVRAAVVAGNRRSLVDRRRCGRTGSATTRAATARGEVRDYRAAT